MDAVGIVVIGRNEGERLVRCLESCQLQARDFVYVDSGSSDDSVAAATRLGATVVELDISRPFSAARARNAGFAALKARNARVRFVQFVDGDCELEPDWIGNGRRFIEGHTDVAVVCGRRRERHPERSIYNALCDIEWNSPIGETWFSGGDSLVRVDAFDSVGGFDDRLIAGEEPELCVRLRQAGWKIWRLEAEMTRHDAGITRFDQWWKRNVRGGYGYAQGASTTTALHGIWQRELVRAVLWGALLPLAIAVSAFVHPVALVGVVAYPAQVLRIALRRGTGNRESWSYAFFVMLAKFAEAQGIAKFTCERWRGRSATLIEYKRVGIHRTVK